MFSEKKTKKTFTEGVNEQNKISQGTIIKGDIEAKGGFRIEGKLIGTLKTSGKVVVGKTGFIEGELICENADFEGKFDGTLQVNALLSLKASAQIEGEVSVGKLAIEPGADFNATCVMKGNVKNLKHEQAKERKQKKQA